MDHEFQDDMKDSMDNNYIPMTSIASGKVQAVRPDVYCFTNQIVNVCFVGAPGAPDGWVLIDAGMPKSADTICEETDRLFGENSKPEAVILTHGHFDHVGGLVDLVNKWEVPVYAHEQEIPYLNGKTSYPEPDGSVEGGLVAKLSPLFPHEPISLGRHVKALPADGHVPHMNGWRWIHTPGHAPGHISLFREEDRTLLAGDAFVTVRQDSLYKVLTQKLEISGPPRYFTTDWDAAKESVNKLEALKPETAVTGHGQPVSGVELGEGLRRLAIEFDDLATPDYGKYVNRKH